jgi:hypothetical protein
MIKRNVLLLALLVAGCSTAYTQDKSGVQITQTNDKVRVEIAGQLFTEYNFKDVPRPYCYPILGPGELSMTRDWPMKSPAGEEHDHPHHRSLWIGHENVNGNDFWSEQKNFGKQVHQKFIAVQGGRESGVIKTENNWVAHDGTIVCSDVRTLTFHAQANPKIMDFDITIRADHGDVTFGDAKDGTMAIRVAETMRPVHGKNQPGKGHIVMSTGVADDSTSSIEHKGNVSWGKRAEWVDYYGPVNDKTVGVAIFDNPKNLRHPTTWHVRDYGLFAANPFGLHTFEKAAEHAGDYKIPSGQTLTLKYRFVFHEGDEKQGKIAELYKKYAAEK